jgi:anthranilate phosphoribosyltransferase
VYAASRANSLVDARELAEQAIDSGNAAILLERFAARSQPATM